MGSQELIQRLPQSGLLSPVWHLKSVGSVKNTKKSCDCISVQMHKETQALAVMESPKVIKNPLSLFWEIALAVDPEPGSMCEDLYMIPLAPVVHLVFVVASGTAHCVGKELSSVVP